MAIKQTKRIERTDITEIPAWVRSLLPEQVDADIVTRLRELRFPHPSDEHHVFVFEPFLHRVTGQKLNDVTVELGPEPQDPIPPKDILDPETGEVLIPAGSQRPRVPSVAELHAMPLPEGPQTVSSFGELFNVARRQVYLAAISMVPQWQDGVEE
jgi:hypothetical protein